MPSTSRGSDHTEGLGDQPLVAIEGNQPIENPAGRASAVDTEAFSDLIL